MPHVWLVKYSQGKKSYSNVGLDVVVCIMYNMHKAPI